MKLAGRFIGINGQTHWIDGIEQLRGLKKFYKEKRPE